MIFTVIYMGELFVSARDLSGNDAKAEPLRSQMTLDQRTSQRGADGKWSDLRAGSNELCAGTSIESPSRRHLAM